MPPVRIAAHVLRISPRWWLAGVGCPWRDYGLGGWLCCWKGFRKPPRRRAAIRPRSSLRPRRGENECPERVGRYPAAWAIPSIVEARVRRSDMSDQHLALVLVPFVVVLPPTIGFLFGSRRHDSLHAAIACLAMSIVLGFCCGAASAAAIDLQAAAHAGGNPWIGHPHGVSAVNLLLGGGLGAAVGSVSGFVAACMVWVYARRRR